MIGRRVFWTVAGLLLAHGAFAQSDAVQTRLRGMVESLAGDVMTIALRNGGSASVRLLPATRVTWVVRAKLSDIQPGSYIGTTAVSAGDGKLKALEVHVFPETMRGVGEGHRDWDLTPGSSMTNGTVGNVVASEGSTITVDYKGGQKQVIVPDNAPVVTFAPADRTALTTGANVIVFSQRNADGSVVAARISVGKDGLVPPM
jgi:hypothetical protein